MIHMARNKVILISNHREAECFASPRQAVPPRGGALFKPSGWSAGGDVRRKAPAEAGALLSGAEAFIWLFFLFHFSSCFMFFFNLKLQIFHYR